MVKEVLYKDLFDLISNDGFCVFKYGLDEMLCL